MTRKIKIVTDSTADLPAEFVEENNVTVIPLYVNFPEKTYQDRVDLFPHQFYPLLEKAKDNLPKSSTPSVDDFLKTYQDIIQQGYDIISIHISTGLSSTASMAESAARRFKEKIHIFDSKSISLGIGYRFMPRWK